MWQEAKANDKRIRELMVDHRKRAERRRAYYESRLGDPQQLIRVIGSASKVYPDAEQFYYHENTDNLMPWQGNPDIKIDRFDGRSLLDYLPDPLPSKAGFSEEDMSDELNFERYHDLIEAERLNVSQAERLLEVEEEWTKLLDRHQAKLAMLNQDKSSSNSNRDFGFDYGTKVIEMEDDDAAKESQLLKEVDILQYVDDLTEKDKKVLNEMSSKYGIKSYARLLRVAKKDRDSELRTLLKKQEENKPKDGTKTSRRNERRRRRRRRDRELEREGRYRRRYSPTYEPYRDDDDTGSSVTDDDDDDEEEEANSSEDNEDFVIEFGSTAPEENTKTDHDAFNLDQSKSDKSKATPEKKLTPMEKLKLKMRAGLEKQIILDEKDKRQKEKERELEYLQDLAKNQGLPVHAYLRPEPPRKPTESNTGRYRSPSTDGSESPKRSERRYRSPSESPRRKRSPSPAKKRYRSPSESPRRKRSPTPTKKRYRSPSESPRRKRSPTPTKKRYRSPSESPRRKRSPSPAKKRYRSPSTSRSRSPNKSSHRSFDKDQSKRHYGQDKRSSSRDDRKKRSDSRKRSSSRDRYSNRHRYDKRYRSPSTDEERKKKYSYRSK